MLVIVALITALRYQGSMAMGSAVQPDQSISAGKKLIYLFKMY